MRQEQDQHTGIKYNFIIGISIAQTSYIPGTKPFINLPFLLASSGSSLMLLSFRAKSPTRNMGFGNQNWWGQQPQFTKNGSFRAPFFFKGPYTFEKQMEFPPTYNRSLAPKYWPC